MNLIIVSLLFPIIPSVEVGPNKNVPELQVLSKYLGTWEAEIDRIPELKSVMTSKWILNGNYLELSQDDSADESGKFNTKTKTLMTYDREKKVYRTWSFDDRGHTVVAEGTWNAKAQTMTSTEKLGEWTIVSTADFSKDGIIEWHSTATTEKDDGLKKEASSVSKRRK